jgi:hypothetical protein
MEGRRRSMLQLQARSTHLIFHIGHEMVECLMRKPDSSETRQDSLREQSQAKSSGESRSQESRVARQPRIVDMLTPTLFRVLRWLL